MPDGGFVLIYSDITERKRSEEEIRAARDAAEAALSRSEGGAGQPDPGREDGLAGSAHRRASPTRSRTRSTSSTTSPALSVELLDELKETDRAGSRRAR